VDRAEELRQTDDLRAAARRLANETCGGRDVDLFVGMAPELDPGDLHHVVLSCSSSAPARRRRSCVSYSDAMGITRSGPPTTHAPGSRPTPGVRRPATPTRSSRISDRPLSQDDAHAMSDAVIGERDAAVTLERHAVDVH